MNELKVVHYNEHRIAPSQIAPSTLWVVSTLKNRGYEAYVVGGCIRDLLLNKQPKDFDVVTSAHPHDIKEMFRNSIIIGRRFQLVHILSGKDVIEVSTFRSKPPSQLKKLLTLWSRKRRINENTFGTIDEDALRRDLTINALYYNPQKREILDYVGGYADIKNRRINVIGVAEERFSEDPMRMIRVIRFMAKLNLTVTSDLAKTITKRFRLILRLPSSRLRDEMYKLFLTGHGWKSFCLLTEAKLLHFLFPTTVEFLHQATSPNKEMCQKMIKNALMEVDSRYKKQKPLNGRHEEHKLSSLTFILSVFLWFPYLAICHKPLNLHRETEYRKHKTALQEIMKKRRNAINLPKYLYYRVERIWRLQNMLLNYKKANIKKIMENRNFVAAYNFLKIYSSVEPKVAEAAKWWEEYQLIHPPPVISPKRRRPRRRARDTR